VQAHLVQIERVNPKVNAIVTLTAERALADARRKDDALARGEATGPLFGLPVAHKDLYPRAASAPRTAHPSTATTCRNRTA
jgi:amidase